MYLAKKVMGVLPKRIVSSAVDLICLSAASAICFSIVDDLTSRPQADKNIVYTAVILFAMFLNKDIYFGKSMGKYFNGTRVISVRNGDPASPIQCFVRNLFWLVWPIEGIILFFSPTRRMGDWIAGTRVQDGVEIGGEIKWPYLEAVLSMVISVILIYALFTYIDSLGFMN